MEKRHDRSSVSMLIEHIIMTPKYRGKIFNGEIADRTDEIIREICQNIDVEIIELSVQTNHVHVMIQHPPKISISQIVEKIKSNSSRILRSEFPKLYDWCPKGLWSRGYHVVSVGPGHDIVRQYIKKQDSHHANRTPKSLDLGSHGVTYDEEDW